MYDWLLNNALFVLLVLCAAVITIGLIVTALTRFAEQNLLDCRTRSKNSRSK